LQDVSDTILFNTNSVYALQKNHICDKTLIRALRSKGDYTYDNKPMGAEGNLFASHNFGKEQFMKKVTAVISTIILILAITGCKKELQNKTILLSTTTSVQDSGLMDALIPVFEKDSGAVVKMIAVGSGKAMKMGEDGEADILIVHSKESELKFMENKHGTVRKEIMFNDFVIIGPENDPLKIKGNDTSAALKAIQSGAGKFVSRGDKSGTHTLEMKLWTDQGITPDWKEYMSTGKGMGEVIMMADEMGAYTISDRGTYVKMKHSGKTSLEVLVEGDKKLFNQYSVILVNPAKNNKINSEGAKLFFDWLFSDECLNIIEDYGVKEFGQPLFKVNAVK